MFSKPETIAQQLELTPGMQVADIGAGAGHYSLAVARRIGNGKVFAIDVQKELLDRINTEAQQKGITNIEIVWGNAEEHEGTRLREASIDVVIVANVLFQIEDKHSFFSEISRILKDNGQLMLIDWSESFGGMGPQAGDVVTMIMARDLASTVGLREDHEIDAGEHHWGIIFRKGA